MYHLALIVALLSGAEEVQGPEWEEGCGGVPDAGALPGSAHKTTGLGPIQAICGALTGNGLAGGGDFQDMYLIRITDPSSFSASTFSGSGMADFDTQLFLFSEFGFAQLANDDVTPADPESEFFDFATDGTGFVIPAPGLYYLAISGAGSDPRSLGGTLEMFVIASSDEVSGPDGAGATIMVDGWTPATLSGEYQIMLTGASFAFCPGDTNGDFVVDITDLMNLFDAWGESAVGSPDFTFDGMVDTADLLFLLDHWGPC